MKRRHALRFENGERRGETVPLVAGDASALTLGRRPGNGIVVQDPSVSGRHAEFSLDDAGVTLRDLASTNGTKVGGERISEQRLAHGDEVHFGNVRATFLDTLVEAAGDAGPIPATQPRAQARTKPAASSGSAAGRTAAEPVPSSAARAEDAGDDVRTVSADALARSRGRFSGGTFALLAVIAAAGAGAWFWLRSQGGGSTGPAARAVIEVPGNLLSEGASFEDTAADGRAFDGWEDRWSSPETAPAAFDVDGSASRSGEQGLSAVFSAGEWAEHRSDAIAAPRNGAFEALGWARTEGARAEVGLRFESSKDAARPFTVWSETGASDDFEPLEVTAAVPPGYDRVSTVLRARSNTPGSSVSGGSASEVEEQAAPLDGGWAEFDDVSMVSSKGAPTPIKVGEYEFSVLGSAAPVASLFKIDRVLISGLAAQGAGGGRLPFSKETRDTGLALFPGAGVEQVVFFAEPELVAGGVATVLAGSGAGGEPGQAGEGGGGYRTHQVDFERDGVGAILLGAGRDMVRVGFSAPVSLRGRPDSGSGEQVGFRFTAVHAGGADPGTDLGPGLGIELKVAFNAERDEGQGVARRARQAEQAGEPGNSVQLWDRILNEFPYDAALLEEATASRGRMIGAGLGELRALSRRMERADFFRLVDDYRACRADVAALTERYAGTEVQSNSLELLGEIEARLGVLEGELDRHERARLESIARTLEATESPQLAARVKDYLTTRFAGSEQGEGR